MTLDQLPVSLALFYRDRGTHVASFGTSLQFSRLPFGFNYSYGGLGGGSHYKLQMVLYQLHFGLLPEIRLDRKSNLVLRGGPQFGFLLGGTVDGSVQRWSIVSPAYMTDAPDELLDGFRFELRFLLGIGYRWELSEKFSIHFDPYITTSISSWHTPTSTKLNEVGLTIGFARSFNGKGIWKAFREGAPVKAE